MRSGQPLLSALGLIMIICCPYRGHAQELPMVQTPSPVKGLLGQNLTIPCLLDKDGNRELDLDLSKVGVRWSKIINGNESDVYKFPGNNGEEFRSGSFIDMEELKRGNFSLTLPRVQGSDEGEYNCTVFVTPKKGSAKINVQLSAQPKVSLSTIVLTVEQGRKDFVSCDVGMFYPQGVQIRWGKYNESSASWSILDTKTYLTLPEENSDGSFNVSSLLIVAPISPEENGDIYSCIVKHASLSSDRKVYFTLAVNELSGNWFSDIMKNILSGLFILIVWVIWHFTTGSPKISEVVGLDNLVHMKRSPLKFMVSGFKQKNIEIHLYLKRVGDLQKHKIASWKYASAQAFQQCEEQHKMNNENEALMRNEIHPLKPKRSFMFYSCLCSTYIIPDKERDEGADLSIEVLYNALESSLTVYKKLKISSINMS